MFLSLLHHKLCTEKTRSITLKKNSMVASNNKIAVYDRQTEDHATLNWMSLQVNVFSQLTICMHIYEFLWTIGLHPLNMVMPIR